MPLCYTCLATPSEQLRIGLFEEDAVIDDKIKWARTEGDADRQNGGTQSGVTNLLKILETCDKKDEADAFLRAHHEGAHNFKELKGLVTNSLQELSSRLRVRRKEICAEPGKLWDQVEEMSARARVFERETLQQVREAFGLPVERT